MECGAIWGGEGNEASRDAKPRFSFPDLLLFLLFFCPFTGVTGFPPGALAANHENSPGPGTNSASYFLFTAAWGGEESGGGGDS